MAAKTITDHILNFNIDAYLNPYLPPSILPRLPIFASYPLGYRKTPPPALPTTIHTIISVVATFLGLFTVTSIINFSSQLQHISTPVLIPSLGAGAVLNYVTPNLPAAQPRPTILGQTISATVGVAIAKAFLLAPERFDDLTWIATPTAVAAAVLAMRLTNTVHPPGGATAALTVATSTTRNLSWWIVALVALSTSTMVGVGLVVNNVGRRWPEFWWSSEEMGTAWKKSSTNENSQDTSDDEEKAVGSGRDSGSTLGKSKSNESGEGVSDGVCKCCGRGG